MPSLQVRDLPEHIYQALKKAAEAERRSLSQQAIIALAKGLRIGVSPQKRRTELLASWDTDANRFQKWAEVDVTSWIRNDRMTR